MFRAPMPTSRLMSPWQKVSRVGRGVETGRHRVSLGDDVFPAGIGSTTTLRRVIDQFITRKKPEKTR